MNWKKVVFCIFTLIVVFVFTTGIYGAILHIRSESGDSPEKEQWDSLKFFPYTDNQEQDIESKKIQSQFDELSNLFKWAKRNIEESVTDDYQHRIKFVLIKKQFEKSILGYDLITSTWGNSDISNPELILLENGYLHELVVDNDISKNAERFVNFANEMKKENRNFLLFMHPSKAEGLTVASEYMNFITDYAQKQETELIGILEKNDIDYLKSNSISEKIKSGEKVFFMTDNHWLPQTALLACKDLTSCLNANYGYKIDTSIYDSDNYTIEYAENRWLGSLGKKATEVYAEPELFPILIPKYETDYTVFLSKTNKEIRGNIQETLYNENAMKNNMYQSNFYGVYSGDNQALVHIHNNSLNNGNSVLIIKESFGNTMFPFLGNIAEDVFVIDLRYFAGSLRAFIDKVNPSMIIFVYSGSFFSTNFTSPFDFR